MDENNVKLLIFCRGEEQLKTSKRKTWSRSKNSRLPVAIIFWGLWDRLCYTGRFATTILSSTQYCNDGTMLQTFETISQHYSVALKIVVANLLV